MNDLSNSHETSNGAGGPPMPAFDPTPPTPPVITEAPPRARVIVPVKTWLATSETARAIVEREAIRLGILLGHDGETVQTTPIEAGGAVMGEFVTTLTQLGIEHTFAEEPSALARAGRAIIAALKNKGGKACIVVPGAQWTALDANSRVAIIHSLEKLDVFSEHRPGDLGFGLRSGPLPTDTPDGLLQVTSACELLKGLAVDYEIVDGRSEPPAPRPPMDPRATTPAKTRAVRDDEIDDDDEGIDESIPHSMAEPFANALTIALKAAPRKKADDPAVAFVVLASDAERGRMVIAARDGRRWHEAYVPTSRKVDLSPRAITVKNARSLLATLNYACKEFPKGARIRFGEYTSSNLMFAISCGKPEPLLFQLKEFESGGEPEGWKPPRFSVPDAGKAAIVSYDAKCLSEATSYRGGGAKVKRDEVDSFGRRHITLTDSSGVELLRAVLVPDGQTDGLPESKQEEIPGTLTPSDGQPKGKGRKRKVDMEPGIAAGPAVKRTGDGKWRLERSPNGKSWHTLESGTSTACHEKFGSKSAREGGAWLRIVRPDGTTDKIHEGAGARVSKRTARAVAKPAARKPTKRLDTNVTPVGARKPARIPKKGARTKK